MLTFPRFLALAAVLTLARELGDGVPTRAPPMEYTPNGAHVPPTGRLPEYWAEPAEPPLLKTEPPFPVKASKPEPMTELLGQPLPIAHDDPEAEKELAFACAHALEVGSRRAEKAAKYIRAAGPAKAQCIIARALRQCLEALHEGLKDDKINLTRYDRALFQASEAIFRKVHQRMNGACRGVLLLTPDVAAALELARYGVEQLPNQ